MEPSFWLNSVAGVEVGTEVVWDYAEKLGLPRLVLVTKMDRENANFQTTLNSISQLAGEATLIPVLLPWGSAHELKGVIDLFNMQARPGDGSASEDIPAELVEEAEAGRITLVEAAAEGDDALLEKYLNGDQLTPDEIIRGFKKAVGSGRFIPVFAIAAGVPVGIVPLLESLVTLMPSPAEGKPRTAQGAGGEEELVAADFGTACGLCVEDDRRSVCREADLPAGFLGDTVIRLRAFGTTPRVKRNGWGHSSCCAARNSLA